MTALQPQLPKGRNGLALHHHLTPLGSGASSCLQPAMSEEGAAAWLGSGRPWSQAALGRAQLFGWRAMPKVCRANCTVLPGARQEAQMCGRGPAIYI